MVAKARVRLDGADPINRGLIGFWPLTEGGGAVGVDISPCRRNATHVLDPQRRNWRTGRAISYNGSSQYSSVPVKDLSFASGSVSWWQNTTAAYNSGTIRAMWGVVTGAGEFTAQVYFTDQWAVGWRNGGTDSRIGFAASATNWPTNSTNHYAFTWDATGSYLYLNGSLIGSTATAPATVNLNDNFAIGAQGVGYGTFFPGAISNFRILNRRLRLTEIQRLYREPWAGTARPTRRVYATTGTTYNESISDTAPGTDAVSVAATYRPSISDSGAGTDAVTAALTIGTSVSDSAAGTDALASTQVANIEVTDAATGTDALETTATQSVDITDNATPTDSVDASDVVGGDTHDGFVRRSRKQRALDAAERRRREALAQEAVALRLSLEAAMGDAAELAEDAPEEAAEAVQAVAKRAARLVPTLAEARADEAVLVTARETVAALRAAVDEAARARALAEDDEEVLLLLRAL